MSDAAVKPKKQFKSQSVNSLFRQQSSSNNSALIDNGNTASSIRRKSRSPTPTGTTKVKLVAKKSRATSVLGTGKRTSPTPPPTSQIASTSSLSSETTPAPASLITSTTNDLTNSTKTLPETTTINTIQKETPKKENIQPSQPKLDENEGIWSDIQTRIQDETQYNNNNNKPSPTSNPIVNWTSPNSKISSFRKNLVPTPMIQTMTQSPLSKPTDTSTIPSPSFAFFNDRSSSVSLSTRQFSLGSISQNNLNSDIPTWKSSPNIWNLDDRQLSTKSDSAINWSPFDIESLSLDDPFKTPTQSSIAFEHTNTNTSRNGSITSRFFPSPVVDQHAMFDNLPKQTGLNTTVHPTNNRPASSQPAYINEYLQYSPQQVINDNISSRYPQEMVNNSQLTEQELFPEFFQYDASQIPISLPKTASNINETVRQPHNTLSKRVINNEQPSYPEGFASTFYKRGVNNFMFIRELQPKLITSKHRDTVEVRVSFPTTSDSSDDSIISNSHADQDGLIKMRCHIVDVDVRDLEGRIGGIKVSKPPQTNNRRHNNMGKSYGHRGHNSYHSYKRN